MSMRCCRRQRCRNRSGHHRQCATKCGLCIWWLRNGTLKCPLVVFSAPMKSPKQKAVIVSGAAQVAMAAPAAYKPATTVPTSQAPPIKVKLRDIGRSGSRLGCELLLQSVERMLQRLAKRPSMRLRDRNPPLDRLRRRLDGGNESPAESTAALARESRIRLVAELGGGSGHPF
jgi:hypothetical protein